MRMLDKSVSLEEAIGAVGDGATVMIGGFGVPGTPFGLIDELVRQGPKRLTIIKNDANEDGMGVGRLLDNGQVETLVTTHIGLNSRAVEMMNAGALKVEFCAQGILAERIRAGGAGLPAFLTDIGIDTELGAAKPLVALDGRQLIAERALKADFALIHADRADTFGNLAYKAAARNFNPLMAMAADRVIAETETLAPVGSLDPDHIHTPGPFVDCVVALIELTEDYAVVRR